MSATPTHDEAARFNFFANLNKFIAGELGPGNQLAYEKRVLPAFRAEHGRDPQSRSEIRRAMNQDPHHRIWSALKRNAMEGRQQNSRSMVLRQLDELDTKMQQFNAGRATLQLDSSVEVPSYQRAVDIHCMPGSYQGEERPGDASAGGTYDAGLFVSTAGALGALTDGGGAALVDWVRSQRPGWQPKRVLDIGCTVGHNIVPVALAFPECEVVAIDTAAPVLRYAHARAQSLGATNITFVQANGEDLSRWPDGHFDWVQTTMFLHELSAKALPRVLTEGHRVLAPGGLMLHLEQPQYTDDMPLYEQFIRDWDAFNNNEPFWSAMHDIDLEQQMATAGFQKDDIFKTTIAAIAKGVMFAHAAKDGAEDHGRRPVWEAIGAWKSHAGAN